MMGYLWERIESVGFGAGIVCTMVAQYVQAILHASLTRLGRNWGSFRLYKVCCMDKQKALVFRTVNLPSLRKVN